MISTTAGKQYEKLDVRSFWKRFSKFKPVRTFKLLVHIIQSMISYNLVNLSGFGSLSNGKDRARCRERLKNMPSIWFSVVDYCHFAINDAELF